MGKSVGAVRLAGIIESDLPLVLAWRSDREVMRWLPSAPKNPTWESHWGWFDNAKNRVDWMVLVDDGRMWRPVGTGHVLLDTGEVGIIIGEKSLWGKGVGVVALRLMLERIRAQKYVSRDKLHAVIHPGNRRSQRLFSKCGFENTKVADRNGQERWTLR